MSQTEQTDSRRCGTAAGRVAPAHGLAPAIRIVPAQTDMSLALSLKRWDMSDQFLSGDPHPDNCQEIVRSVLVRNEFWIVVTADTFAGIAEIIPVSARCEQTIVRFRLAIAMDAAAHREAILRELIKALSSIPVVGKIIVFIHDGESTEDYLAAGFRDEGVLRNAELVAGAWRDVRVLGVSRADLAGMAR